MMKLKNSFLLLSFTLLIASSSAIVDIRSFFPFGVDNGDQYLNPGDDTSSAEQTLSITFPFFDTPHSGLWINVNGAISFVGPIRTYTPSCAPVAENYSMISPFWADVDTQAEMPSAASAISFRESNNAADLAQAKREIVYAFPEYADLDITWTYIVTWYNVTYFRDDPYRQVRNSFQAALASNGVNSFAIFYYNKIQWTTGDASNGVNGFGGTPAQVGFDTGDGVNRFMLDVSCTNDVVNVNNRSNVGIPGIFVFRIDTDVIHTPPPITRPTRPTLPSTIAGPTATIRPQTTTVQTTDSRSNAPGTPCSTDVKQAWLDIIFVIDTSSAMSSRNLLQLGGEIATFMKGFTFGQTGDHTTRAAIVTYSTNVASHYDLTDTTTHAAFQQAILKLSSYANPDDDGGNVQGALQFAQTMFDTQKSKRRQAIILIAAAYDDVGFQGAYQTAKTIKDNGISILTISFEASDGVLSTPLQNISSPGYYYVSNQAGLYISLPLALTQINCFCPSSSLQYKHFNAQWKNYTTYADCLYGFDGETLPSIAGLLCGRGVLAPVTTQDKMDFIADNIVPHDLKGKKKFLTGLNLSGNQWDWLGYNSTEYPLGMYPSFYQTPAATDSYGYMWNYRGFNWTLMTIDDTPLPYLCQSPACDASNYICDLNLF